MRKLVKSEEWELSLKNFKLNKKRTISTIIGIILSVALIGAVATMATSFQETLIQNAISETGYYHLKVGNVTDKEKEEMQKIKNVQNIIELYDVGYAKMQGIQNEDKPYVHLYSMRNETFENLKFKLIEGRFPENEEEIIISKHIKTNGKVNLKIGDTITIEVGQRMTLDNEKLNQNNPYIEREENINNKKTYNFKIVGIIERPEYSFEDYGDPGYTIISTNINIGEQNIYIALKNSHKYKETIPEILGAKDYNEVKELETENFKFKDFTLNKELLRWEDFAVSDSTVGMLYSVIGVVLFIIIFTSVFCIRNSFAISTTEKIHMYGMLASIGATKRQIKKIVILEAMILGIIGIPLGILSGLFADFVLLKIVNLLLGDFLFANLDGIVFKTSILPILISVFLGFLTIYLSAISSARKASKVSPIEQLRGNNDIKIKAKKLKTPKIIEKVFKTGGVLAYKNLKRSKKKYRTTVISITVSIFIFITMNAFITNAFDLTGNYYKDYDYNMVLYNGVENLSQEQLNKIFELNNIKEKYLLYDAEQYSLTVTDLSKINTIDERNYSEDEEDFGYMMQIVALDDNSFKKYAKEIGAKYDEIKEKGILCDEITEWDEETGNAKKSRRYNYDENDTITGLYGEKEIKVQVGAVTADKPYGLEGTYSSGGYLIFNKDYYKDLTFNLSQININSNNAEKLQEEIENLKLNISINNMEENVKEEKAMVLVIKIFLYGFIAVITLIGVTNIFNTITSNMELRQKEFAMLKSIGMTKKEFNRMINLETLFYGTKSLIYGIILGLIGTYAIYNAFAVKIDAGVYIPIKPIILSIIFVFILIFIIMRYSIFKINKQNIIETIRKENV